VALLEELFVFVDEEDAVTALEKQVIELFDLGHLTRAELI